MTVSSSAETAATCLDAKAIIKLVYDQIMMNFRKEIRKINRIAKFYLRLLTKSIFTFLMYLWIKFMIYSAEN